MANDFFRGSREWFPGIGRIPFEGPSTRNPLAFRSYDPERVVAGRKMRDWFRFSMAYWHTLCGDGSDPFGNATLPKPWKDAADPMTAAAQKADAAFEFMTKAGLEFYCFHDIDAAPDAEDPAEAERNLAAVTRLLKERQDATGVKLLWATANLFSHPRYMNGAATNPDFRVVARAATQVKAALDADVALGGANYVFWGGREGYSSLWNTDMRRELEHLGRFLVMARDYGRKIGFKGTFLVEPKPMEPSKHQYDFDSATVIGFLRAYGLEKDFKLNIEANHATLAGHDFAHDLQVAADAGMLGSIDANRGDPRNGWDTDQFPNDLLDATAAMRVVLAAGGLGSGGFNFDAKPRRNSTDLEDLFIAHIGGMDTFAEALLAADRIREDGRLGELLARRYSSFDSGDGKAFEAGTMDLERLCAIGRAQRDLAPVSGKQEWIEQLVNRLVR